jgi:hypothetical protein
MVLSAASLPHNSDSHPVAFLSRRWVQNILLLATSLLLHVGIVVVGIALYAAVHQIKDPNRDQQIVPEMSSISSPMLSHPIPHRARIDPMAIPIDQPSGVMIGPDDLPTSKFPVGADPLSGEDSTPAPGPGDSHPGQKPFGPATDAGPGWQVPGNGGPMIGPGVQIGVSRGNAHKVVFLCDASGSMLGVFGSLKQQLRQSISALQLVEGQSFNVIFFSDDNAFPLFKDGVRLATDDNKKIAMDFIDSAIATGGTQPLAAIHTAMNEHPELIFLLTDGFDQTADFGEITRAFSNGNKDGKIHINCIFLQSDEDPRLEAVLKQIAAESHGDFKKILKSDM